MIYNFEKETTKYLASILAISLIAICFLSSVSDVDAANDTITNTTEGGLKLAIDTVEEGTVYLEDGVYSGENNTNITITKNLTIIGKSNKNTIIDAQGNNQIFTINGDCSVILINLTFINGKSHTGGAIYNSGDLSVSDCSFVNNSAGVLVMVVLFIILVS